MYIVILYIRYENFTFMFSLEGKLDRTKSLYFCNYFVDGEDEENFFFLN